VTKPSRVLIIGSGPIVIGQAAGLLAGRFVDDAAGADDLAGRIGDQNGKSIHRHGHFDCGCGQAAQPVSLEIVICSSEQEVEIVVGRMKQHAAGHQCWQEPAMAIVAVPGQGQILHEVKQLPQAYLLFPDAESYSERHDQRKNEDAKLGRTTRAEGLRRIKKGGTASDI